MWINLKHLTVKKKKSKTKLDSNHTHKKMLLTKYVFLKKTSVYVRATIYQCTTHKICIGMLGLNNKK